MFLISESPKESICESVKLDNKCTKVGIQKKWKNNAKKKSPRRIHKAIKRNTGAATPPLYNIYSILYGMRNFMSVTEIKKWVLRFGLLFTS